MYLALTKNTKRIDAVDLELEKELSKIIYLFLFNEFCILIVVFYILDCFRLFG